MSDKHVEQLTSKIRQLEDENGQLLAKVERLEMEQNQPGGAMTIHGLAAMVLQISKTETILYVNSTFEEQLDIDRNQITNAPLSAIDHTPLGKGFLQLIHDQVLQSQENLIVDHNYTDPHTGKVKHIKVTGSTGPTGVQILMEDQSTFKRLESTFKRYVSPKVIDNMIKDNFDLYKIDKYELSVLFADLRGFTRLCTVHTPEEVKWLIDRYLGVMMRIIIDEDATVDKMVGDEVMALFGAPIRYEDHAVRAVNTALRMQEVHTKLMEEWRLAGITNPPPMGIGINSGEMIVGNIGSELRMDYTVLGHHVNLAARLCSAAKPGEILVSPRTFALTRKSLEANPQAITRTVKFRSSQAVQAKGIDKPIEPINVVLMK